MERIFIAIDIKHIHFSKTKKSSQLSIWNRSYKMVTRFWRMSPAFLIFHLSTLSTPAILHEKYNLRMWPEYSVRSLQLESKFYEEKLRHNCMGVDTGAGGGAVVFCIITRNPPNIRVLPLSRRLVLHLAQHLAATRWQVRTDHLLRHVALSINGWQFLISHVESCQCPSATRSDWTYSLARNVVKMCRHPIHNAACFLYYRRLMAGFNARRTLVTYQSLSGGPFGRGGSADTTLMMSGPSQVID